VDQHSVVVLIVKVKRLRTRSQHFNEQNEWLLMTVLLILSLSLMHCQVLRNITIIKKV